MGEDEDAARRKEKDGKRVKSGGVAEGREGNSAGESREERGGGGVKGKLGTIMRVKESYRTG